MSYYDTHKKLILNCILTYKMGTIDIGQLLIRIGNVMSVCPQYEGLEDLIREVLSELGDLSDYVGKEYEGMDRLLELFKPTF